MNEHEDKIACHVCQQMIPKAAAIHAEGEEYVLHFCNLDCMEYWKRGQGKVGKESQEKK